MKFNGEAWELFGDVITGEVGHAAEPLKRSGLNIQTGIVAATSPAIAIAPGWCR